MIYCITTLLIPINTDSDSVTALQPAVIDTKPPKPPLITEKTFTFFVINNPRTMKRQYPLRQPLMYFEEYLEPHHLNLTYCRH